jgi:hypothetical protein
MEVHVKQLVQEVLLIVFVQFAIRVLIAKYVIN